MYPPPFGVFILHENLRKCSTCIIIAFHMYYACRFWVSFQYAECIVPALWCTFIFSGSCIDHCDADILNGKGSCIAMSSVAPTLLDLLEKWTQKTPNKIAMSFLNDSAEIIKYSSLTYSEISVRSSQLAAHLASGQTPLAVGNRYICSIPQCCD